MKLCSFRAAGRTDVRVGVAHGGGVVDLTALNPAAFGDMVGLIRQGDAGLDRIRSLLSQAPSIWSLSEVQLAAPIPTPPRFRDFLCFEKHFRQSRANRYLLGFAPQRVEPAAVELPAYWYKVPVGYKGNTHNFVGPDADVYWPTYSKVIDYEFEIGIVAGLPGKDISPSVAMRHVYGFTIFNDFSARDIQYTEMSVGFGPSKSKDFDTGNALGPWLVTLDELPSLSGLDMITRINGVEVSRGNASEMRHKVEDVIVYASMGESLVPGEILGTGTVGNGCGMELGRFLKHHDTVELELPQIGVLRNRIVAPHVLNEPALPLKVPL